jgi:hypothetical protein
VVTDLEVDDDNNDDVDDDLKKQKRGNLFCCWTNYCSNSRNTFAPSSTNMPGGGDDDHNNGTSNSPIHRNSTAAHVAQDGPSIMHEVWTSSELLFSNKLSWLLILGPVALVGDSTGYLGEAACFALSGIALIPCAERYVACWDVLHVWTTSSVLFLYMSSSFLSFVLLDFLL